MVLQRDDDDVFEGLEDIVGSQKCDTPAEPLSQEQIEQDREFVLANERQRLKMLQMKKKIAIKEALGYIHTEDEKEQAESGVWLVWKPEKTADAQSQEQQEYKPPVPPMPIGGLPTLSDRGNTSSSHGSVSSRPSMISVGEKGYPTQCGWMTKQGGGSGTFSRKSWKHRWFEFKDGILTYHKKIGTPELGTVHVRDMLGFEDGGMVVEGEGFAIQTTDRTYFCMCASPAEKKDWIGALRMGRKVYRESFSNVAKPEGLMF